jgi:hypothetical protein
MADEESVGVTPAAPMDGRYVGSNGRYWLELRVDLNLKPFGMISGDLQLAGSAPVRLAHAADPGCGEIGSAGTPCDGGRAPQLKPATDFCASFRTTSVGWQGAELPIEWTAPDGGKADGSLELAPSAGSSNGLVVTLALGGELGGLPAQTAVVVNAARVGDALRVLGLEIETEVGVTWPGEEVALSEPVIDGHPFVGVRECLGRAGFTVQNIGSPSVIPKEEGGWAESDIFATLDRLMRGTAQATLDAPAFEIHLLALSRTDRGRLLGLMFDAADCLPRQGAAVFVDTIRDLGPQDRADRKIIETAVHEIGHALNLVHRFDRAVRRSDSTSFMNYDWRYRGGDSSALIGDPASQAAMFWSDFKYKFDDDELRHLRHAARPEIVPGGAPFGSVAYWTPTGHVGDIAPPNPPWDDLRLWLTPPKAGTTFAFGQPVFLTVSLMNVGSASIPVARHALDVKAGQLELLIRPWTPAEIPTRQRLAESKPFVPIMRRCFDMGPSEPRGWAGGHDDQEWRSYPSVIGLGKGESIHANANLAYSADGVTVDPGEYEVTPFLSFPPGRTDAGLDQIVVGRPLRIRVRPPQTRSEERDGQTLYRPDVGVSLALGGSTSLQAAADDLEDLRSRREHDNSSGRPDPVVAVVARSAGIHEGRQGNTQLAARLLGQATTPEELASFDPHTAEHTRRLAERYKQRDDTGMPISVVVDLWTRRKAGSPPVAVGPPVAVRGPGFLVVQEPSNGDAADANQRPVKGTGWGVLAPATSFPPDVLQDDANEVFAEVTVAPGDGLTQRIAVNRIDVVTTKAGDPSLAILALAHPVPADRRVPVGARTPLPSNDRNDDISRFFDRPGTPTAVVAALSGDELAGFAAAADQSLADAPPGADPAQAAVVHPIQGVIGDLANWFCDITPFCEPPPPPNDPTVPRGGQGQPTTEPPSPPSAPPEPRGGPGWPTTEPPPPAAPGTSAK